MPRYAPKMSMDDFKSTIVSLAIANDYEEDYGPMKMHDPDFERIMYQFEEYMPKVWPDLAKIDFSTENTGIEGFHMTADGVPFMRLFAGGDWENALAIMVYFDGKNFRGYVPKDGNSYNHGTKTAYGNADDPKDDSADILKRFGKIIDIEEGDYFDYDTQKVIADFEKRIVARGTAVAVDYGESKADKLAAHRKTIEPDLTILTTIPKDLIYFEVHLAGGGAYFKFILRAGGRVLNASEGKKVEGVGPSSDLKDMHGEALWYSPQGVYPRATATVLIAAGYTQCPTNASDLAGQPEHKTVYHVMGR